jgi:hypothetical protein
MTDATVDNTGVVSVRGVRTLRVLVAGGGVLLYVGLYAYFIFVILGAEDGAVAEINSDLIYMASAIGGVLATFFAVTLGVRRKDPEVPEGGLNNLAMGATVAGGAGAKPGRAMSFVLTLGFWAYALVGVATIVVVYLYSDAAPDIVKGTATAFAGYLLAVLGSAFAPASSTP